MFFIFFLLVLIMVTAFFAAAETALTVSSKAKIHHLIKEQHPRALSVRHLQNQAGSVISSLLAGGTFINVMVAYILGGWAAQSFDLTGQTIISILNGAIILIYGEAVPKMVALYNPENILLRSANIIKIITKVFMPLNSIITFMAKITLKLFRFQKAETRRSESIAELRSYIDMQIAQGILASEENIMLTSILDLAKIQVKDIMIYRKNVQMINIEDSNEKIIQIIKTTPFTRLPVYEKEAENIIGVVHVKAFLEYFIDNNYKKLDILKLVHPPWFVPENTDLLEQLKAFKHRQEHFCIIVDEYGMFQGIVTLEDVLEEIVGDITDEYDIKIGNILHCSDGSFMIPGNYPIRDLNKQFNWELPDDYATIAGLLLDYTQTIPKVGQVYEIDNIRFEVRRKQKNTITLIKGYHPKK